VAGEHSVTATTEYEYDANGQVTAIQYPGGVRVDYARQAGRVQQILSHFDADSGNQSQLLVGQIGYQAFGGVQSLSHHNGIVMQRHLNLDGLTSRIQLKGQNSNVPDLADWHYGYDALNNIRTWQNAVYPASNQQFHYDKNDRLTDATGAYGQMTYQYDDNGNRKKRVWSKNGETRTETYQYETATNRLEQVNITEGGESTQRQFSRDATGNTTQDVLLNGESKNLEYNEFGRLQRVEKQ